MKTGTRCTGANIAWSGGRWLPCWKPLPRPERADLVDRRAHASDTIVGCVRNAHLAEAERQAGPKGERDALRSNLVESAHSHCDERGVTGEGVERPEADADLRHL